jgi:hypothetical protein
MGMSSYFNRSCMRIAYKVHVVIRNKEGKSGSVSKILPVRIQCASIPEILP